MSKEKEFARNTVILAIGSFMPKLVAIIVLPVITGKLTKEEFGTYDLIVTITMLLVPVATLQIQSAAFRFLIDSRNDRKKTEDIISNTFMVVSFSFIWIVLGILFFFNSFPMLIKVSIGMYYLAYVIQNVMGQIVRGLGNNGVFSISAIILSIVNAIGVLVFVYMHNLGLHGGILALCIANMASVLYLVRKSDIGRYINRKRISFHKVRELLSYSLMMIPNNLSNWILMLSDRFIINAVLGLEATAIYAVANKIPNFLFMLQAIVVMAWQENASLAVKDFDAGIYYEKMLDWMFTTIVGFTALLIGFVPVLFQILVHGGYEKSYIQIPILIMGAFFFCMSSFFGGIYIAYRKTINVGMTTVLAALCNIIINLLLIEKIGIIVGSVSTLISYFLLYIFRVVDIQRIQKIRVKIGKQILEIFLLVLMAILCSLNNKIINIINIFLGVIVVTGLNWKMIYKICRKVVLIRE